jgi:peroxiredoxin
MVRKTSALTAAITVAMLLAVGWSCAAEQKVALQIGAKAPDWSGIIGTDGKRHGLSDYKDAELIVLVFTCNHCPYAIDYQDRLIAIQKEYKSRGVRVIAVNVNNLPADRLEKMKDRAKEKKYNHPYLYDPTQKMGHDYGATVTPHAFVLDRDRRLRYEGAIDDSRNPTRIQHAYLRDALDALLAGKEPPETSTKEFGCGIKYEKK